MPTSLPPSTRLGRTKVIYLSRRIGSGAGDESGLTFTNYTICKLTVDPGFAA
jgi:hypothetical protein